MIKKLLLFVCIFALAAVSSIGCGSQEREKAEGLHIVTSISILADIAENIVGSRGTVDYLVPIGDNPEDYEPLPSDLQKISNADVLILNGWSVEEGIERSMRNITDKIVFGTEGIVPIPLVGDPAPDPHAWLDALLVAEYYVENILAALLEIDPAGAEEYKKNAKAYQNDLKELHHWIKEQVQAIPEKNRIIVISENAFKYYGEAYGFHTEGIWELNSHEEGTPQQIARVVDLVRENNLPAIFVETTLDKRYMEIISQETGVPIAGEVYTDALGFKGSHADTYIKMMKHNTNVFVQGLSQ
jgi:manganese transport system substrate-binding protein